MKNLTTSLFAVFFVLTYFMAYSQQTEVNKKLKPEEFKAKLSETSNAPQLIDVRTPDEFKAGHISGASNINVNADDFSEKIKSLDKSKPVLVYCRSGKRSEKAAAILRNKGFKELYDLEGGILEWENTGNQVVK